MPLDQTPWSMRGAGRSGVSMWTQFIRERAVDGEATVEAEFDGVRTWLP